MKTVLFGVLAFVWICGSALADPSQKEVVALLKKVERRVAVGDIKALDELTTLPGDWSAPTLLHIFKYNYAIHGATAQNKAIGKRAAQLATTDPGGEDYFVKIFSDTQAGNQDGITAAQENGITALVAANNQVSVRVLCSALDEPRTGRKVVQALGQLNLPDAPQTPKARKDIDAATIAKWKEWWNANRDSYKGTESLSAATP